MSFVATVWAWKTGAKGLDKLVLLNLANRCDEIGRTWPSVERIAQDCGISERAARNALAELVSLGLIKVERRQRKTNLFHVLFPDLSKEIVVNAPSDALISDTCEMGAGYAPIRGHDMPPSDLTLHDVPNKTHLTGTSEHLDRHIVQSLPASRAPESKRESIKESDADSGGLFGDVIPSKLQSPSSENDASGFADFWRAYPRKEAKGVAEKAYARALSRGAKSSELLTALKSTQFNMEDEGKFIPHPATWLNQDRWLDVPISVTIDGVVKRKYDPRYYAPNPPAEVAKLPKPHFSRPEYEPWMESHHGNSTPLPKDAKR